MDSTALKNTPSALGIFFLCLAITVISVVSFEVFKKNFVELNVPIKESLHKVDSANVELFEKHQNPVIKEEEKDILRAKIFVLNEEKQKYVSQLILLYKNYYALLTLFPVLTGLTGMMIFIILQNGWRDSNVYVKAAFMTLALLSSIAGIFPKVYQQSENISRYTNFYIQFSRIQKDIFNYNLTAPYLGKDSVVFNDFLVKLNEEEKNLNDLHFGLEQREITKDIFELKN